MASVKCYNTTEKGLNQGGYGGSANWGWQKKETRYQEQHEMSYSESETHSQARYPAHGMSKHQVAYGKADTWDDHGRSNGHQMPQNGNAIFNPQVHGHGNGYGNQSGNGMPHMQAPGAGKYQGSSHGNGYGNQSGNGMPHMQAPGAGKYQGSSHGNGYGNHTNIRMPHMQALGTGKYQGSGYGYGGSDPSNHKLSGGMGHGYEPTKPYGCEETNGGKFANNGMMAHGQVPLHGKYSGQGNGFIMNHQANHGPGRNMGYGIPETHEYSETYHSNESHYYGGTGRHRAGKGDHPVKGLLRKLKGSISANKSCTDNESDSDHSEEDYEMKKQQIWISKAI